MDRTISSIAELGEFARTFVLGLSSHPNKATLVGLSGDLGSGKTAFVKAVAQVLGVDDEITSPTFVIEKKYTLPAASAFRTLVHIDAYRLHSGAELKPLRFEETLAEKGNLILVEWPEQVADALPQEIKTLRFTYVDETTRSVVL